MQYFPATDISVIADLDVVAAKLQPGQWVRNGHNSFGRFAGVTRHGTIVIAWGGARSPFFNVNRKFFHLRNYARRMAA